MNEGLVRRFLDVYEKLDRSNIDSVTTLYTDDIVFIDPVQRVEGLAALQRHLRHTYENVSSVHFDYHQPTMAGSEACIRWRMFFTHPRLNGGRELIVPGVSFIRGGDKITYHEDYYDMGALLYEHVPLLGGAVRFLKRRLQSV
jgi:hypothetical protein